MCNEKKAILKNTNILRMLEENPNSNIFSNSNKAWVSGIIEDEFSFSHASDWEKFYTTRVVVERLSGVKDYIPILVSKFQLATFPEGALKGKFVEIGGNFRTYMKWTRTDNVAKKHLESFLFAKVVNFTEIDDKLNNKFSANEIYLKGTIKTTPICRDTASGRQISDFVLKVVRGYNHFDIIPCLAWGEKARYIASLNIGDEVELFGRIQSREYFKRISPGSEEGETKVTYEVSIMRLKV